MNVYLRKKRGTLSSENEKRGKNRKYSLYLVYHNGPDQKREYEYLKLYIYEKPKTLLEKEHNKETMHLAETIRAQKILDRQSTVHGYVSSVRSRVGFLAYFKKLTDHRYDVSAGNHGNWLSTYKHLHVYMNGKDLPLDKIDDRFLEGFKEYLLNCKQRRGKSMIKLNANTALSYFNKVRATLREAYQKRMIKENPALRVKSVKSAETHRNFLSFEELQQLAKTECEMPVLKKAFLFSALTGLRYSDINGGIAGVKWKAAGDGTARAYGFTYDNVNRLTTADFSQQNSGSTSWTNDKADFSVSGLAYDAGSNILSMKQKGLKLGSTVTIDSLTYQYFTNSNQLQKVNDGITDNSPFGDFKDTTLSGDDYSYDINGNITKDYNRRMHTNANGAGAVYNYLDKPDSLVIAGKATLYYYYDVTGVKHRKKINDYTAGGVAVVKDYLYINGFVYLNDTLQYVMQEEGRIRYAQKRNSQTGALYYAFEYNYFLRDHLSNVRTVLTEGRDTSIYAATMEPADSAMVRATFSNVYDPVNTVLAKPGSFDTDNNNNFVSRLNASSAVNKKTGPSLVLKVMAGDQVQINTFAYYNTSAQSPDPGVDLSSELLNLLSAGIPGSSGGKIPVGTSLNSTLNPGVVEFLTNNRSYDDTKPKAYLNWILFDNQFNYVASNSGVQQVQAGSSKQALIAPLQTIAKNGYLYVYVSNESPQDVYFDDLTVKHYTGPLVQEQAYYPFGLQMAGISDKAFNKLTSQYKFNGGVELEEDYSVNLYSTFYRQYDPQLGRFNGVDVLSEQNIAVSGYQFGLNNPIFFNDPFGDKQKPTEFNDVSSLIKYLVNSLSAGLSTDQMFDFGGGDFISFFNFGGRLNVNIFDFSDLRQNKSGQYGFDVSYSYTKGGYYDESGIRVVGEVVLGNKFIPLGGIGGFGTFMLPGRGSGGGDEGSCPSCLNPSTTGHNLLGLTYPGGDNPRSYNGEYNYSYVPTNLSEYPAIGHDRRYDNLKINGASGLFTDTRAIGADWTFVKEELSIAANPAFNPIDRASAGILGFFLGLCALPKTAIQLSTPGGYTKAVMWYSISNQGVNNAPSTHKH